MSVVEVVDGEVVEDARTALILREGLDLSDAEQARELERRIEQMGLDGDTSGLLDADNLLGALHRALRDVDAASEQIKTAGILRIKTWVQLGGMDDLGEEVVRLRAMQMRALTAVQERGRLPELIAWAQANDTWGITPLYRIIVPWGCAHVRAGALKGAIERSGLSVLEIARRSGVNNQAINILWGRSVSPSQKRAGLRGERVRLEIAKRVGAVVGYEGNYPPAPPRRSRSQALRKARERRLYGKNLPATGDWRTVNDSCRKICSALNALDAANQNIDGLWLNCDVLFRAAQEGLKGLREQR